MSLRTCHCAARVMLWTDVVHTFRNYNRAQTHFEHALQCISLSLQYVVLILQEQVTRPQSSLLWEGCRYVKKLQEMDAPEQQSPKQKRSQPKQPAMPTLRLKVIATLLVRTVRVAFRKYCGSTIAAVGHYMSVAQSGSCGQRPCCKSSLQQMAHGPDWIGRPSCTGIIVSLSLAKFSLNANPRVIPQRAGHVLVAMPIEKGINVVMALNFLTVSRPCHMHVYVFPWTSIAKSTLLLDCSARDARIACRFQPSSVGLL
eukprot:1658616-Amphidinium_carterae.1